MLCMSSQLDTVAEKTVNTYDGNGNLTETQTFANDVLQTTTSSLYDADNRVYSSTDDLGGNTTTVYDANGNVIQTTTPDGMVTDSVYNAQGQVTYTDDPHLPGEPTNGTLTEYDQDGNVIGTEELSDVVITVTETGVDVGTSVLTSVGAIRSTTSTTYDAVGLVAQVVDASGTVTTYQYDSDGNPVEVQQTANGITRTTTSAFDALGRVTSTADPLGLTTQYQYDADSDVTKTVFADGSSITDLYDSQGNLIGETDQNGQETQYEYNAYGDLVEVIEPSVINPTTGESVSPTYAYAYDIYGDQTSTTDALGNTTTYTFDSQGDMRSETLPMGQTESWDYNGAGELTEQTDFDGNVIDYAYNDLGQVTLKTVYAYNDLTTPYETVGYEYNVNNTSDGSYQDIVQDSLAGTTTSTYDVNGNLIQIASPQGTIDYAYNAATGEETEVSTSDTDTQYGYGQAGELTTVTVTELQGATLSTPLVTSYSYDLDGNLVLTQNANGTTETRTYNDLNELTAIVDTGPLGVFASFAYTYDSAGHVRTETDLDGRTDEYRYDALYRLIDESITDPALGDSSYAYAYDLDGNRVSETDTTSSGSVTQKFVYNANDELTRVTNTSTGDVQNYFYDSDGNTTEVQDGDGTVLSTYTWDPQGRMIGASTGGNTVSYTYDDAGDRTSETVHGQTTTFLNDPNQAYDQVLEEYANGGVLAATYIRGIDLLFEDQSGTLSYYVSDNLGSTRALTNSAGAATDTFNYDAYGNMVARTGTTANPYLFTGQWFDAATGQYYQRARYYDPATASFVSRDTYDGSTSDPITENHYAYANADPANVVDPSGHEGDISEEITVSNISATFDGITQEAIQQAGIKAITQLTCMAVEDLAVQGVYILVVSGLDGLPIGVYVGQSANIATRVSGWVTYWSNQNATAKLVRAFQVTTNVSTARAQKFVREYVEQTVLNAVTKTAASEGVRVINDNNPISPVNLARRIATHLKGVARKTFSSLTKVLRIC
jgi:RHS repeat-associated protein